MEHDARQLLHCCSRLFLLTSFKAKISMHQYSCSDNQRSSGGTWNNKTLSRKLTCSNGTWEVQALVFNLVSVWISQVVFHTNTQGRKEYCLLSLFVQCDVFNTRTIYSWNKCCIQSWKMLNRLALALFRGWCWMTRGYRI